MITQSSSPQYRQLVAKGFSVMFFLFSLFLAAMMFNEIISGFIESRKMIGIFLNAINTAVVALAIFELGTVVSKEYCNKEDSHIVVVLRRTLPRFISIVCIALALEGLLMVIKYSQLDMAGNLYYPVAIIIATSLLIIALGVFLRFTSFSTEGQNIQMMGNESECGQTSCVPACPATDQDRFDITARQPAVTTTGLRYSRRQSGCHDALPEWPAPRSANQYRPSPSSP